MSNRARMLSLYGPPLLLMAVIFWFSSMPSDSEHHGAFMFLLRKLAHFSEYALLTYLWWRALAGSLGGDRALITALAISIGYAVTDEFHQTFVDGRTGTPWDVLLDSSGAFASATLIRRATLRHRERR